MIIYRCDNCKENITEYGYTLQFLDVSGNYKPRAYHLHRYCVITYAKQIGLG